MPYGWALWLRALPAMPAKPHARARDVAALLAERPGTPIPPGRELATWPAFFSLFHQGWLTLGWAALLFVLLDVKSRREERWLADRFPAYADYRRRTRRLIPWLY